ncbi:MAG: DUF2922 domain-containing protein [Syntrophomonadaceae bacterium]
MAVDRTIELGFITNLNKTHTIRIAGAKENVTEQDVAAVMDTLVAKDVFVGTNGTLSSKKSARLVTRQIDEFNIA